MNETKSSINASEFFGTLTTGNGVSVTTAPCIGMSGFSGNINLGASTSINSGSPWTLQGTSTTNFSTNQIQNNMRPTQVKVAVFTITRDEDTNEINSTKFLKELWVEVKNGVSIDLIVAKQLDKDFDPETTIIKVLSTITF